ncbi:MAG TPA: hypothetical protein PK339_04020 [Flavitalea sp.]|nr:hypothetical protein [Flavitalea sp.]
MSETVISSPGNFLIDPSGFRGRIGVGQTDIDPPEGIYSRNWGAAADDTALGIHRPLKLTCISFEPLQGGKPLVLISADLGIWKIAAEEREFRAAVLDALSLEEAQLMFCLSHTHAGPSISLADASMPGGQYIAAYREELCQRAVAIARTALSMATAATLTWYYSKCDLAANRDLPKPGTHKLSVGFNPGQPADDTLLTGRIVNDRGDIMAVIVNYACHPTTLAWDNRLISPDYIGAMREVVEHHTQAPCLFLQGASGELAPAEQYTGAVDIAERHGRRLGYCALAALEAMLPPETKLSFSHVVESGAPLGIWEYKAQAFSSALSFLQIDIPLLLKDMPSLAVLEQQWSSCPDRVLKERLWRKMGVRKTVGNGDTGKTHLWIWRLGNSFLIGQPNEAYSIFQLELRRGLMPNAVAAINLVNGSAGYLPPRELYDQENYTVEQTPFARGSLELLIEVALSNAATLL